MTTPLYLKKSIVRNLAASFLGKVFAAALGIVSVGFMTRALGADDFGAYSAVFAFLYIFSVLGDFGLAQLLIRDISRPDANEQKIVSEIFSVRIVLVLVFFTLAWVALWLTPYPPAIKLGVLLATPGFVFLSLSGVLMGVFQKHLATGIPALADIASRALQLALVWYLYLTQGSVGAFLGVFVAGSALHFSIMYFFARRFAHARIRFSWESFVRVVRTGWPLALSTLLVLVYFKGDALLLSLLRPAYDVGIYGVAYKLLENIIFFPAMFVGLIMPLLSRYFNTDRARFTFYFQKTFDALAMMAIPLLVGGFFLADGIIRLIAGSGFEEAGAPFRILLIAIFFIFFGALFGNAVIAVNKHKEVVWVYGAAAIVNIAANWYFIPTYSFFAAAWITVFTELFVTASMAALVYHASGALPRLGSVAKSAMAALGMLLVLKAVPHSGVVALFCVGVVSYGALLILFRGISRNDLAVFLEAFSLKKNTKITQE